MGRSKSSSRRFTASLGPKIAETHQKQHEAHLHASTGCEVYSLPPTPLDLPGQASHTIGRDAGCPVVRTVVCNTPRRPRVVLQLTFGPPRDSGCSCTQWPLCLPRRPRPRPPPRDPRRPRSFPKHSCTYDQSVLERGSIPLSIGPGRDRATMTFSRVLSKVRWSDRFLLGAAAIWIGLASWCCRCSCMDRSIEHIWHDLALPIQQLCQFDVASDGERAVVPRSDCPSSQRTGVTWLFENRRRQSLSHHTRPCRQLSPHGLRTPLEFGPFFAFFQFYDL